MKKLQLFLAVMLLLFAMTGSAMAIPTTLYDILGYEGTQAYSDTGAEYLTITDMDWPVVAGYLFHETGGQADTNAFGIYDFTDENGIITVTDTLELFPGPASPITTVYTVFDFDAGTATANEVTANIDATFGFYIYVGEEDSTFYSHVALNDDDYDHFMIFDTTDNLVPALLGSDIVVAIEDLPFGGDADFDDMVVGGSTPEPATMLLLGSGLIGLAAFGRKKFLRR
jgi:hypothetical protein